MNDKYYVTKPGGFTIILSGEGMNLIAKELEEKKYKCEICGALIGALVFLEIDCYFMDWSGLVCSNEMYEHPTEYIIDMDKPDFEKPPTIIKGEPA